VLNEEAAQAWRSGKSGNGGGDVYFDIQVSALDGADVERVFRYKIIPAFRRALVTNTGGLTTALKDNVTQPANVRAIQKK
jgi:hypothetical protein